MKRLAMVVVVVSVSLHVTLIIPQAEAAEFRYSVAPLNIPFSAGYYSPSISDMNASRQIVGMVYYDAELFDTHSAAFFWQPGMAAATIIEPPDRFVGYAGASAINASGQAVVDIGIGDNITNVIRTDANFANQQILASDLYNSGIDINSSGVVVGVGSWPSKATIWPSPVATPIVVPRLPDFPTTQMPPSRCFSINDFGQVIGLGTKIVTNEYGTYDASAAFFYTIANNVVRELTPVTADRRAYPLSINKNGLVVGSSHKPGYYIYYEPTYWDVGGAPHAVRDKISVTFLDGHLYDIDDDNNMYISTHNRFASTDYDVWVYNPLWTVAKKIDDLIPADSGYHVNYMTTASPDGLLICSAKDAADNSVQLLLTPYDVDTADVGAGSAASTTLLDGITQPGGVGVTFSEVTVAGEMVAHYGSASSGSFALQFLPDPADMDDVAGMIPGDEAQHWLVDFEGGTFTGPVTLTFCYDDSRLPDGFDENQLVLFHYVDGVWETIVPSDIDPLANTVIFNTDSFSPFVLGAVPEPCTALILALSAVGLLQRRRRKR